jgi:hypothetical protein
MSWRKEYSKWSNAEYPYDDAECGLCATGHDFFPSCCCESHNEMRTEAKKLELVKLRNEMSQEFPEVVTAFREKYARFYRTEGV